MATLPRFAADPVPVTADWDLPSPFVHAVTALAADIDAFGHVNNSVYLRWLDQTAWAHSAALGVTAEHCVNSRRGMVVWRSQLHYQAPSHAGDRLEIGTWLVFEDARLRVDRRFQIRRPADGRTLLRGLIHYVCADLDSGRPTDAVEFATLPAASESPRRHRGIGPALRARVEPREI